MQTEESMSLDQLLADFTMVATYIPTDVNALYVKPVDTNNHGKGILRAEDLNKLQLRYTVDILYKGRKVLTSPYSMGIGHIPKDSAPRGQRGWTRDRVQWITEVMKTGKAGGWSETFGPLNTKPILPKLKDVMYCLCSDAQVLNSGGFEDWANEYGYDTDSRKAEDTYRECLDLALKLKAGVGVTLLESLQTAFQDY